MVSAKIMSQLHCDPGFQQLLAQHFSIELLEQHPATVYGLWPDLTLAYMNPAWFDFARNNGGEAVEPNWSLGRVITDALPEVLHPFYVELYLRGLENQDEQPLQHAYECSSPEQYRWFEMSVHNLGYGAGLLIINRDEVIRAHRRDPHTANPFEYRDIGGVYHQCSHCRCYRHGTLTDQWHWIPGWICRPQANIDHTLCPGCFDYYYGLAS